MGSFPVAGAPQSYWQQEGRKLHLDVKDDVSPLPTSCDVAIIGGGYAGIATAYHLLKSDKQPLSVVLLEARKPCSGATGRNGGHFRPDYLGAPGVLLDRFGSAAALEVMQFELDHINTVKELLQEEGIDCDFKETTCHTVLTTKEQVVNASEKYKKLLDTPDLGKAVSENLAFHTGEDARRETGYLDAKAYFSMPAAQLSAYKLLMALLERCIQKGLSLKSNAPVVSVQSEGSAGYVITTGSGEKMTARKVVFATNAYTSALLPEYSTAIVPCKGVACHIAAPEGETLPQLPTSSFVSMNQDEETKATGYNYMVQLADNSIVVGGAHHKYGEDRLDTWYNNADESYLIERVKDYYEDNFMQRSFVGWEDTNAHVSHIWAGVMGYSTDSLPHIGRVPDRDGSFVIAGFHGHGMPVIYLAAKGVAAMVREGIEYGQTGLPALYATTKDRLLSERNDILAGRGFLPPKK